MGLNTNLVPRQEGDAKMAVLQLKQCYISGAITTYQLGYYSQILSRRLTPLTMLSWENYWPNTVAR